jgi:DnaD/phage-associated family protein
MTGYRQIHSQIWSDSWFSELAPEHKLLFIYLFSNSRASVSGLYELPLRFIAFETGFAPEIIQQGLDVFARADKVRYDLDAGVVWVRNMPKYQSSSSPKLQARIEADIKAVPECSLKQMFLEVFLPRDTLSGQGGYGIDTLLSISSPVPSQAQSPEGGGVEGEGVQSAAEAYAQNIGVITPLVAESLRNDVGVYGGEWVCSAIEEAVKSGARNLKYVEAILKRWKRDGKSQRTKSSDQNEPKGYRGIRDYLAREEQKNVQ